MIWFMISKGGPVMVPIILGSILGLAIIFERAMMLISLSSQEAQVCLAQVVHEMRQGHLAEALAAARPIDHPVAAILRRGLEQWGQPISVVERGMEQVAQQQVRKMETWLGGLASVITVEPMLGFLGTITGLIRAFMAWEAAGAKVTVSVLAGGIYEAMITTAAGLIIAIPFLMAHNAFISRIKRITGQMTDAGNELLELYARQHPMDPSHESSRHTRLPAQS